MQEQKEMINYSLYEKWYKTASVKFEIIKSLKNREFALLSKHNPKISTRMLKCHSVQHFDFILSRMVNMFKRSTIYNFYYSLASYKKGLLHQDSDLVKRKAANVEWQKEHHKHMLGFDFVIDIDADSIEQLDIAYESAKIIKKFFDETNCPYQLRYSGKGFHFIIPYEYFKYHVEGDLEFDPYGKNNIYRAYLKVAKALYSKFSELIDLNIYDSRRVLKIPYSLAVYPESKNLYICFPFNTSSEFDRFDLSDFILTEGNYDAWSQKVFKRGIKTFNEGHLIDKMIGVLDR